MRFEQRAAIEFLASENIKRIDSRKRLHLVYGERYSKYQFCSSSRGLEVVMSGKPFFPMWPTANYGNMWISYTKNRWFGSSQLENLVKRSWESLGRHKKKD